MPAVWGEFTGLCPVDRLDEPSRSERKKAGPLLTLPVGV